MNEFIVPERHELQAVLGVEVAELGDGDFGGIFSIGESGLTCITISYDYVAGSVRIRRVDGVGQTYDVFREGATLFRVDERSDQLVVEFQFEDAKATWELDLSAPFLLKDVLLSR